MRVASAVITQDRRTLFYSKDPDKCRLASEYRKVDKEAIKWVAKQLNESVGKKTAKVVGLGKRASKVPDSRFPSEGGGLFSGLPHLIRGSSP